MAHQNRLIPGGSTKALGPCAKDAFSVFEDLCLLANSEENPTGHVAETRAQRWFRDFSRRVAFPGVWKIHCHFSLRETPLDSLPQSVLVELQSE
ncbi:hypothetical protein M405DRAFT_813984 [Rhizopogon salebrosus TDB-379]|nr:hypothetical protein M405DRAFT_813984 [Rhizopogon salebrosus TDB-379]